MLHVYLTTGSLPTCFVLMPIADAPGYEAGHFARVYEHLLKPAIIAAGFNPVRADDAVKTDYIVVGIIQKIVESEMVLCDFSARNPNVMYELGIRHAFSKPVVLIRDKKTDKIFDIQGLRYTEYDEALRVDTVNKDVVRISAAVKETATTTDKDMNSIVALAGLKTAQVPKGQTISPDTKLLLDAISALDGRIQRVEDAKDSYRAKTVQQSAQFSVDKDEVLFSDGTNAKAGEKIYKNGDEFGIIQGLNYRNQSIIVRLSNGELAGVSARSDAAKHLSNIPF